MNLNILKFEKMLNIKLKNQSLLIEALTHKSSNQIFNNEKLEFLGDRVIAIILSKKLYDLYPKEPEGILDKRFAQLVNRKTCANISILNKFNEFVIFGNQQKKITEKDEKILSDVCESVIGAVFIDRGYNYAKEFVLRLWKKELNKSNITVLDSKTKLQEYSLKLYKKLPKYILVSAKGPKHNPIFKIHVSIENSKKFTGKGNSKKLAEQDAAKSLLKSIKNL